MRSSDLVEIIRQHRWTLGSKRTRYRALLDGIGDARVVMIGEASHGTHEFYRIRAEITQRLITERGFKAVAVEADWPDAYRVNRYVRGVSDDTDSVGSLGSFQRFPAWMWRNKDVVSFIDWLREYNASRAVELHCGFYGLDLYSLHSSMRHVLTYLDSVDPEGAFRARRRYACFDRFGGEAQQYGYATTAGLTPSCEKEVLAQLVDLQQRAQEYHAGRSGTDEFFFAEQNARLVANAEEYYRTMFLGRVESWNVRDRHMTETLVELIEHLGKTQRDPKVVIWAHNSHLGDARATEMGDHGELTVGQLVRQWFGGAATNIGFTTHTGTVTAASDWGGPAKQQDVLPSFAGSYERLFHDTGLKEFALPLKADNDLSAALGSGRLERAIGVIYVPETERQSHYFHARLSDQFDFVVHIDETTAVQPLDAWCGLEEEPEDIEDTYPSGM